jgi:hypothetical protein
VDVAHPIHAVVPTLEGPILEVLARTTRAADWWRGASPRSFRFGQRHPPGPVQARQPGYGSRASAGHSDLLRGQSGPPRVQRGDPLVDSWLRDSVLLAGPELHMLIQQSSTKGGSP